MSEYPEFVFISYDQDISAQTYDIAVSCEAGSLVGKPVKYVRHDLNIRAAPDVPELVRYDPYAEKICTIMGEHYEGAMSMTTWGEYVRYDQAAAIIAAKDAEIFFDKALGITYKTLVETLNAECKKRREQAEAAEAKLTQYEAQEPVGWVTDRVKMKGAEQCFMNRFKKEPYINPVYASPAPTK